MKTFQRHKTYEEIKAQCAAQSLYFGDTYYRTHGGDTIKIAKEFGNTDYVIFNTTNGRFFGSASVYGQTVEFNSDTTTYDGEPWFDALLDFFLVEKDPTPVTLYQQHMKRVASRKAPAATGTLLPYQPTLAEIGEDDE